MIRILLVGMKRILLVGSKRVNELIIMSVYVPTRNKWKGKKKSLAIASHFNVKIRAAAL